MAWNTVSDVAIGSHPNAVAKKKSLNNGIKAGLTSAVVLIGTYYRQSVLPEEWHAQIGLLGNTLGFLLVMNCLSKLYDSRKSKQQDKWEKDMSASQKKLFGFPTADVRLGSPGVQDSAPRRAPLPPLGVPERNAKPITPHSRSGIVRYTGTPYSSDSRRELREGDSPFSPSPVVVTPEQLKPYLVPFEMPSVSPREGASNENESRQPYAPLFSGTEETIQNYRPSLQLKSHNASPLRPDAALYPSSREAYLAVLARLETDERTMDTWVDRLREWLAIEVFKPLHRQMLSAHLEVSKAAAKLGGPRLELTSLADLEGPGGRSIEADEDVQLSGLSMQLQNALKGSLSDTQRQDVVACLQAAKTYQSLSRLLKGESPSNLLAPVPPGYIASRVTQLAEGPCLKDFTWNSGGSWRGKPWSNDLLTDSALVFYIFAAFLQAPGWYFPHNGDSTRSLAAPLYIGTLPARPARCCTALLPVRPTALPPESTAILALGLASTKPQFTLVLECKPVLTMSNYRAVFIHILLLLQSCKLNDFETIGNNNLKFLKLDRVLAPARSILNAVKSRWFLPYS